METALLVAILVVMVVLVAMRALAAPAAPAKAGGCASGDDCKAPLGCVGGACAKCTSNDDCQSTGTTKCNTSSGKCVNCTSPDDCTGLDGCYNDTCGPCNSNLNCRSGTQCEDFGYCYECIDNESCPDGPKICAGGVCSTGECETGDDCKAPMGCTPGVVKYCGRCYADTDCQTTGTTSCVHGSCV